MKQPLRHKSSWLIAALCLAASVAAAKVHPPKSPAKAPHATPLVAYIPASYGAVIWQFRVRPDGTLISAQVPSVPIHDGTISDLSFTPDGRFAYAVNDLALSISQYAVQDDGTLTPLVPPFVPAGKADVTSVLITPDGKNAYLNNLLSDSVSQYRIGRDGGLYPLSPPSVPTPKAPIAMQMQFHGRFLYCACIDGHSVAQYRIGKGGTLHSLSPPAVPVAGEAREMALAGSGRFAYVVVNSGSPDIPNGISQFRVGSDGTLHPLGEVFQRGPKQILLHPNGRSAYVVNGGNKIGQYRVGVDGRLWPLSPAAVKTGDGPGFLTLSADGRNVYVANFEDDTISQYRIDGAGHLVALSPSTVPVIPYGYDVESRRSGPEGVALDPEGRFAYTANNTGGTVSQFRIDAFGGLHSLSPAIVPIIGSTYNITLYRPKPLGKRR